MRRTPTHGTSAPLFKTLAPAVGLGFALGTYVAAGFRYKWDTLGVLATMGWEGLSWMWVGIIGGASVGGAIGYLEKGKEAEENFSTCDPALTREDAIKSWRRRAGH